MSDVQVQYEFTKKNTPIPAGWALVDAGTPEFQALDPNTQELCFWVAEEQRWSSMKDGYGVDRFAERWSAGATLIIKKVPVPVAPPVMTLPPMAPPAFLPQPVAEAPAPVLPPFLPTPVAAPAPILPPVGILDVPGAAITPAPTFLPPSVVEAPAPVVEAPAPSAATSVVRLFGAKAPVAAPSPEVTEVPTFTPPAATTAPAFVPALPTAPLQQLNLPGIPVAEVVPESEADPNVLEAMLEQWEALAKRIKAFEEAKDELRKRIVKTAFPDGLKEGVNKAKLPDGGELVITGVKNRTVDEAYVSTVSSLLAQMSAPVPFKQKFTLDTKVYKTLAPDALAIVAQAVTEKDGAAQIEIRRK